MIVKMRIQARYISQKMSIDQHLAQLLHSKENPLLMFHLKFRAAMLLDLALHCALGLEEGSQALWISL